MKPSLALTIGAALAALFGLGLLLAIASFIDRRNAGRRSGVARVASCGAPARSSRPAMRSASSFAAPGCE